MFKITFLPARFGDAIWIEYGDAARPHTILIDGGTAGTRRQISEAMQKTGQSRPNLDLLVISHIDRDHLEGILGLLEQDTPGFTAEEVWFNAFRHLPEDPDEVVFSPMQAERLTERLDFLGWDWNKSFGENAVCMPAQGLAEPITLAGGMKITLLTPTSQALFNLRSDWEDEIRQANLRKGAVKPPNDEAVPEEEVSFDIPILPDLQALSATPFQEDTSSANHSSISFLAEYQGLRALFAADAPAGDVLASLEKLSPNQRSQPGPAQGLPPRQRVHHQPGACPQAQLPALRDLYQRLDLQAPGSGSHSPCAHRQPGQSPALFQLPQPAQRDLG